MEQRERAVGERERVHTEQWPGSPDVRSGENRRTDTLLRSIREFINAVRLPESTYRLQFHKGFTFRDATAIVPYLAKLGITHVYASPYLKAAAGSTHGYDVVDHCQLNPEIGSEQDFEVWIGAMRSHGMSHILDTVPNHVGIGTNDNHWWNDVLENGPASRYASYFDIAWQASPRPELQNRVLLPVLGDLYGRVLERGELQLAFSGEQGTFAVCYYDHRYPISPCSYGQVLGHRLNELLLARASDDPAMMEYRSIMLAAGNLPDRLEKDPQRLAERDREKEVIKRRLADLVQRDSAIRQFVEGNVQLFNGKAGESRTFDRLDDLLSRQCYRLACWRNAAEEINYRRFFDINNLAALAIERQEVFEATHRLTLQLCAQRKVAGLRIDHPDGLYDPEGYFARLQRQYALMVGEELASSEWERLETAAVARLAGQDLSHWKQEGTWPLYVVAEKILAVDEPMPREWAVYGTSGYDFLNMVNGAFVDQENEQAFTQFSEEVTGDSTTFEELVHEKKLLILDRSLSSELQMLTSQLDRIAQKDRRWRDFTFATLHGALREVIACFPVYRAYISDRGVHDSDRANVEAATRKAAERRADLGEAVFECVRDVLVQNGPDWVSIEDRAAHRRLAGKFQQVTAPVTAKGVEDTAFYLYHRLISLNEVGGEPGRFGVSLETFHHYMRDRQQRWPYALSTLSTHDTKRSEDVRARINVLSEIPDQWREQVAHWRQLNALSRKEGSLAADEEYLLYQTLIGARPLTAGSPDNDSRRNKSPAWSEFISRIQAYMLKAIREAKLRTTWTDPNPRHEQAVQDFVARIFESEAFLGSFGEFQRRAAQFGLLNSLSQTVLKLTCPGVPDTYQGTELWDFSLVDPDNRRPVDYATREKMLPEMESAVGSDLLQNMADGRAKLFVTATLLQLRQQYRGLFTRGEYVPLAVTGSRQRHVIAFGRREGAGRAVVVVPRFMWKLLGGQPGQWPGEDPWGDTYLRPLDPWQGTFRDALTGKETAIGIEGAPVGQILAGFPAAVLIGQNG